MSTYNCTDSTSSAYGAGGYGICTGQAVGAPNTGVFEQAIGGGSFTILLPLALAVLMLTIAGFTGWRIAAQRKRKR